MHLYELVLFRAFVLIVQTCKKYGRFEQIQAKNRQVLFGPLAAVEQVVAFLLLLAVLLSCDFRLNIVCTNLNKVLEIGE